MTHFTCNRAAAYGYSAVLLHATCLPSIHLSVPVKHFVLVNSSEYLSHDVATGSEITPCIKINKVVYRLTGNVMTSITVLRI